MRHAVLVLAAALAFAGCAATPVPTGPAAPAIVPRAQWGATAAEPGQVKAHAIERITLHHGGVFFDPARDTGQYLRALQSWSRSDRRWPDVPYHYVIDPQGRVFEGREIAYAGDTNTDYDPAGHALVVVLGNFDREEPNERQVAAVVDVMAWLSAKYGVPPDRIAGHRDHSRQTTCPGTHLARYLESGELRARIAARLADGGRKP